MRVAPVVLHIFEFETKQAKEIHAALKTHINDAVLRRNSKVHLLLVRKLHAMKRKRLFRIVFLNEDLSKNKELDELREMKEDIDRKNEETAATLRMQGAQLAKTEALYKEEQMKGKIRVYCRRRPLSDKERDVLTSVDEFTIEHPWKDGTSKQFVYDRVFDDDATQEDVFEDTRMAITSRIFAYGQTGPGRHIQSMELKKPGLTPSATAELFKILRRENNKYSFSLKRTWWNYIKIHLYQEGFKGHGGCRKCDSVVNFNHGGIE
ncbi:hypothetical protein K1719_045925 [Acacia pycnantha]|nr:hypothetical protein K1719_045925 [Acacia pycnantha]